MQRAVVALKKSNGKYKVPKFSECLLEYFGNNVNSLTVNFKAENGIFLISEDEEGFELRHSPECPVKLLSTSIGSEVSFDNNDKFTDTDLQIGIAASVIIESSDSYVLLTKRPAQMRSSPNVWVPPGGHVEYGETIQETGIREVQEETGLIISNEKTTILGLWENVYPLLLGVGHPKHHTLVIYLHTCLNETHNQLTKKLLPNPEEVDSFCWLSYSTVSKLFSSNDNFTTTGKQYVFDNGKFSEKTLNYSSMFNRWLWRQPEPYSGVNYALKKWLQKHRLERPSCKF